MDLGLLEKQEENVWKIAPHGNMRVPAVIYATESLMRDMDHKVYEQICNVATLPGIVTAAYAMPDAHWGYGFPIGGVAAFDAEEGGVISAGGVGFDISCGVRALLTGLKTADVETNKKALADQLYRDIPAGLGSTGRIHLNNQGMSAMLRGGAKWAVEEGFGDESDLFHIEERGCQSQAEPERVSAKARKRQQDEMGTLGSGNHYLEIQRVAHIFDEKTANTWGLHKDEVVVSIHCGSRGLGHQIGTEYLKEMAISAQRYGIHLPDRELACAPILSDTGKAYLGAMRAGINCAFANRQILTHLTRQAFHRFYPQLHLPLLYDVSHNTCKPETHEIEGRKRTIYVHRKGATRAFGPGHPELPDEYRQSGQPVIIGGSMGTGSYILAGTNEAERYSFSSACHGAGRAMSRHQAKRRWQGRQVMQELDERGIFIRSRSLRGVAEEAPGAYKDVGAVVEAADEIGLAKRVAFLEPLVCIKG